MNAVKWLVILVLTVTAVGLLAFGPRADEQLPKGRVIVDYWEKWTGAEEQQMRSIVDELNNTVGAQKGIYVRYVSTAAINQKTLVATAAGVPPDIAGLYDYNLVQFAAMDALEPLEDLAREHGIVESYYKPSYWKPCNYDGHLYALISTPVLVALHYNTAIFAECAAELRAAGLDPNRAPRTIDELDAYANALTKTDSQGRLLRAGFLPMEPTWFINFTCFWFGGRYWDPDTHRFTMNDPNLLRMYHWIAGYTRRLGPDASMNFQSGFGNFDSPQNAFMSGMVAMEQQGPYMANFIYSRQPKLQWAVAPFPSAVPGLEDVTYVSFDALTIPRGARHKREAFEFIAYVNRQDVMEKLCKLHCKNSPLARVSDDFLNNHPNPYIKVFERLANSPNAMPCPQIPIMPEVLAELTNLAQQVSRLQVEPEPALAEIGARMQAKYDLFVQQQQARRKTAR
jgi:multiple sugar transport system substrate-binding protein